MRLVTYTSPATGQPKPGVWNDGHVYGGSGTDLIDVIAGGHAATAAWAQATLARPTENVAADSAGPLAPIPVPPSIRDFMAFEEHVVTSMAAIGRQIDPVWYEAPVFYFSNPAAVLPADADVEISPGTSAFDYEIEIAAIIGLPGRNIPVSEASQHIAGYTILVDWSARDLQEIEMRSGLGPAKGKDSATTLGPNLVTPDELEHAQAGLGYDRAMTVSVNAHPYSSGNWSQLYWSFEQMISYASRGTELRPGDVIGSGTVGTGCILELSRVHGPHAYPYLQPGDRVSICVEGLGTTTSTIRKGPAVHPLGPGLHVRRSGHTRTK
jgi:2-keto-4-pentenoate hydratase/2-oxohepta-3-ene-1,7-dioic acid hydratase in catechol pathway